MCLNLFGETPDYCKDKRTTPLNEGVPDFHTPQTQAKRDKAAWVFDRFGPGDPPKKRRYNPDRDNYINAFPLIIDSPGGYIPETFGIVDGFIKQISDAFDRVRNN